MSYLETLNSHNTQIQNLINKANSLPDAGGGSGGTGVELCTVSITAHAPANGSEVIYYTDGSSEIKQAVILDIADTAATLQVAKNSLLCVAGLRPTGNSAVNLGYGHFICVISDNITINLAD